MRALDLFCKAGGASMGLHQAGFDVTGVDIEPQPRYPFKFIQGDALTFDLSGYDFIWASPVCKAHTKTGWAIYFKYRENHTDMLTPIRARLNEADIPWVIENVPGAPMRADLILCGSAFGLKLRRHRLFEASFPLPLLTTTCNHGGRVASPHGHPRVSGEGATWGPALGIDWMNTDELSQAIPPAYSKFIAEQFLKHFRESA